MKTLLALALGTVLAVATTFPAMAQDDEAAIRTATAVLDRLDAGDFEGATTDFNADMKAKLGAAQLAGVQARIESAGAVQSRDPARVTRQGEHTLVVTRIHRAQAAIDATVVLDAEGHVAGLFFAPAGAD
jgi:hypothetical protein